MKPVPKQTEDPFQSNGARTVDFQKHIRPILEASLEESGAAQLLVDQALSVQLAGSLSPDQLEAIPRPNYRHRIRTLRGPNSLRRRSRWDQNTDSRRAGALLLRPSDDDFDVLIERIQESEEAVGGESFKPSVEQRGHPGLASAEQVRRRLLRQFANHLTPGCAFGSRWAYVGLELPRVCAASAR